MATAVTGTLHTGAALGSLKTACREPRPHGLLQAPEATGYSPRGGMSTPKGRKAHVRPPRVCHVQAETGHGAERNTAGSRTPIAPERLRGAGTVPRREEHVPGQRHELSCPKEFSFTSPGAAAAFEVQGSSLCRARRSARPAAPQTLPARPTRWAGRLGPRHPGTWRRSCRGPTW